MKYRIKLLILIVLTLLLVGLLVLCVHLDRNTLPEQKPSDGGTEYTATPSSTDESTVIATESLTSTECRTPTDAAEPTASEVQSTEAITETAPETTETSQKPASGANPGNGTAASKPNATVPPITTEPTATQGTNPPMPPAGTDNNGDDWGGGDIEF